MWKRVEAAILAYFKAGFTISGLPCGLDES
jgi:hypothetical protein